MKALFAKNGVTAVVFNTLMFISLLFLFGFTSQTPYVKDISQAELIKRIDNKNIALLLDVRTPNEFKSGYIKGAVNIPHTKLSFHIDEIKPFKNQEIIIYCHGGVRALIAVKTLQHHGFSKFLLLQGHIKAWNKSKLPLEIN